MLDFKDESGHLGRDQEFPQLVCYLKFEFGSNISLQCIEAELKSDYWKLSGCKLLPPLWCCTLKRQAYIGLPLGRKEQLYKKHL